MNIPIKSYSVAYRIENKQDNIQVLEAAFENIHQWDYDSIGRILYIFDETVLNHEWLIFQLLCGKLIPLPNIEFSLPYSLTSIPFGLDRRRMMFKSNVKFSGVIPIINDFPEDDSLYWISNRRVETDTDIQWLIKKKILIKMPSSSNFIKQQYRLVGKII